MLVATLLLPPLRCFSALVRLFVVDPRITDSPLRKSFVPEFRPGPSPLRSSTTYRQAIGAYFIYDVLHYHRADARAIVAYVRALLRGERNT